MASKQFLELQDLSDEDIRAELREVESQYQKLKFDHAIRGLENPLILRQVRRNIARLKTEIRRRNLIASSEEELANRTKIRARRRRK
jgi:large subunit ribosomal protein L29